MCTWTGEALASWILERFAKTLSENDHAVMVLDGAAWHAAASLRVPDNITLVHQPPYSPECNPIERIWLFLRERFLSLQVWPDKDAIMQACCEAWNALVDNPERIQTLCLQPWTKKVISWVGWYQNQYMIATPPDVFFVFSFNQSRC